MKSSMSLPQQQTRAAWQQGSGSSSDFIDLVNDDDSNEEDHDARKDASLDNFEYSKRFAFIGKTKKLDLNLDETRDAIIRSFKIKERDFRPKLTRSEQKILVEVFHPVSRNLLGFIRFEYDSKEEGTLEITNFHANLEISHLVVGSSSKRGDVEQAGQHGEGMKLACLLLRRKGYAVGILSSGFDWKFLFDKRSVLNCHMSRLADAEAARDAMRASSGVQRLARSNAYMDVSIRIGFKLTGLDDMGIKRKTDKIPLAEFERWMETSLDLQALKSVFRTSVGDILLDEAQSNKLYLRSLLLPHGSSDGSQLRYGYNFLRGNTSRERVSLLDSEQEFSTRWRMWEAAVNEYGESALVIYTNLILEDEKFSDSSVSFFTKTPEPMINGIGTSLITQVWRQMLQMNGDAGGRSAFYYNAREANEANTHIITQYLKKHPYPLRAELWIQLRRAGLCRTPAEEQLHIFSGFPTIESYPKTEFAVHLSWMLDCCFKSHSTTAGIEYEFVNAGDAGLDLGFRDSKWLINARWLAYDGAHKDAFCEENAPAEDEPFFCDHVVLWLWDLVITGIIAKDSNGEVAKTYGWLKSMVGSRLAQMPRLIQCRRTPFKEELEVSWDCTYSEKNKDNPIRVTLHANNCTGVDEDSLDHPLRYHFRDEEQDQKCGCAFQVSTVSSTSVTFTNLDSSKKHLAKVSLDRKGAFFGLAPTEISPYAEDLIKPEKRVTATVSNPSAPGPDEPNDNSSDDSGVGDVQLADGVGDVGQENGIHNTNATATTTNDDDDSDNDTLYRDPTRTASPSVRRRETEAASSRPDLPSHAAERRGEHEIEGRHNAQTTSALQNRSPPRDRTINGRRTHKPTDTERNNPVSGLPHDDRSTYLQERNQTTHPTFNRNQEGPQHDDDEVTVTHDSNRIAHLTGTGHQESALSIIRPEPTIAGPGIYQISTPVSHRDLNWESGFPGTHDFFRTASDPNTFIAKPKTPQSSSTTTTTTTTVTTTTTTTTSTAPEPSSRKHPRSPNTSPPNKRPRTHPS
ncbi:hypothetical protein BU24DRAFT_490259 [Aaosphaeria arxii CBS 175.79]|uniref:Uncharacterized protein n=1 Tax=Aaosphaeria arxii CBS 175.79 TaxID=1450172 RepID=A0A6A5XVR7_9PLEO|nr:uncharacterized protein BU24DRAFT_490259 [Aaosphaeria arxii CBS 175.79]KAF2017013.1 hypothetical protein BU24DRAFT_490259 [Aaosphaeria arxii CBS 175.79]